MRSERLAELVKKLDAAREDFRRAMENDRRVDRLIDDLGMPHPDGTEALREANRVRSLATDLYVRALQEFTDFLSATPTHDAPASRCSHSRPGGE